MYFISIRLLSIIRAMQLNWHFSSVQFISVLLLSTSTPGTELRFQFMSVAL